MEFGHNPYIVYGSTQETKRVYARQTIVQHPEVSLIYFDATWENIKKKLDEEPSNKVIWMIEDFSKHSRENLIETIQYKDRLLTIIIADTYDWENVYRHLEGKCESMYIDPKIPLGMNRCVGFAY